MKTYSLLLVVLFTACQTISDKGTIKVTTKPAWTAQLPLVKPLTEAKAIQHKFIEFDKDIFKFKNIERQVSLKQKSIESTPNNALHLIINHGINDTSKESKPEPLNLSRVENSYHNLMGISGGKAIRQIGYSELVNSSPDLNSPVHKDYIIGPGDKIQLSITGPIKVNKVLTVTPNGTIFVPERIGAIQLFGIRKSELQETITKAVSKEYKNFKLEASLATLRTIRILLTGKISQPGLKNLNPGSTLIDAISSAGGIHKDGSLRHITIKNRNGKEYLIDLYDLMFKGRQKLDLALQSGDQIIIPPITNTVCLLGQTGQGIYEIKNESLEDLLKIHGQLNAFVSEDRVLLERTTKQKQRELLSMDVKSALKTQLKDGYTFEFQGIRERIDNTVEITGQITRPGTYPWKPGMTVKDLLKQGEGFLMNAAINKALIRRRLAGESHYQKVGGMGITRVREELIWIPIDQILSGDTGSNLELQQFDSLRIMAISDFQDKPQVEILGAIRKAGKYDLTQQMTLGDLLTLAGNPAKQAHPGNGVIVRKVYNTVKNCFDVKMFHFNVLDILQNKQASLVTLEDADQVIIRTAANQSVKVKITGQVQFPGSYILPSDSQITDLIKAAGGLLHKADLRAAEFIRESIRQQQEKRLDALFEQTRRRLSRSRSYMARDGHLQESYASTMELRSLQNLKNEMFKRQIKGRVVLDFLQDDYPTCPDNLILEENDSLNIPQQMNSVMVMGHVYSPNAFVWREKLSVKDYLEMSGGYREEAGKDEVYLILASGQVKSAKQTSHDKLMDIIPGPGDTLLIPKQEMDRSGMAVASDYLSLFRQAAELGAISNAIPHAEDTKIGINSDKTTRDVTGGSYTPLLK